MNGRQFPSEQLKLPRSPVLGWATFCGPRRADSPCILDRGHTVFTTSGRAAIVQALKIAGIGPGDRVLVPTYHCPTMISPITSAGAEPVFYPIAPDGSPRLEYLDGLSVEISAIIAAHFFGMPQRISGIRRFCDRRGIFMIEDCAHAFFGEAEGRPIGHWGDVGIASLTKFFPVVEGGCLVSENHPLDLILNRRGIRTEIKTIADTLELGAGYRRLTGLNTAVNGVVFAKRTWRSLFNSPGPVGAGDDPEDSDFILDRAAADAALARSAKWLFETAHRRRIVENRQRNYRIMTELLTDLRKARPLFPLLPAHAVPYVFPLWVESPEDSYQVLRSSGIPIYRWDRLWPSTPSIEGDSGKVWANHVFQLGCHQDLSASDLAKTAEIICRALA